MLAGDGQLGDLDVRAGVAHQPRGVLVVLDLAVDQLPAEHVTVERDGTLHVRDREAEVPDAEALHRCVSLRMYGGRAPGSSGPRSGYTFGLPSNVSFEVMNSTRMPSGSIMYTARPPVLGPMVGVTGGLTERTPLAVSSS